jgi:hypothetical protein
MSGSPPNEVGHVNEYQISSPTVIRLESMVPRTFIVKFISFHRIKRYSDGPPTDVVGREASRRALAHHKFGQIGMAN